MAKLLASLGAEVPRVTKVRSAGALATVKADARAIHNVAADRRVVQLEHDVGAALDEFGGVELGVILRELSGDVAAFEAAWRLSTPNRAGLHR